MLVVRFSIIIHLAYIYSINTFFNSMSIGVLGMRDGKAEKGHHSIRFGLGEESEGRYIYDD